MKKVTFLPALLLAALLVLTLALAAYTVSETQQVIVTQFGKPIGKAVTTAGLKFKVPFIHQANFIEKRVLAWDGDATSMPTKDKLYISVDTYARWRIVDPLEFLLRLRDERSAQSRLDDILGSETRNAVAKHELIEIIRTSRDRRPEKDEALAERNVSVQVLKPIEKGRSVLEAEILAEAKQKLREFGIELLDVRFKRIDYNPSVKAKIYTRMISERQQIAEAFRSEGAGEAAKILGNKERELKRIQSEAYRKVLSIRGGADAEATRIYAEAYNQDPEFYAFLQTMETYRETMDASTTLLLSTDSELFRYLNTLTPAP